MAAMVDNILGFSKARLGDGWVADIKPEYRLKEKIGTNCSRTSD